MPDSISAGVSPIVSRNRSGEAFSDALRLYVGRGRRYSCKDIERGCGVSARMVESYIAGPDHTEWRNPSHENMASLFGFVGPEFTSEWLRRTVGQGAYWLPDGDGGESALNTDCAEFNFEHAKATSPDSPGGAEILPMERKALAVIARRMQPKTQAVAA